MPSFTLLTNVKSANISPEFLSGLTDLLAKSLSKPKSYVVVNVIGDRLMNWGGDGQSPCGTAVLESIGQLGRDLNKKHSKVIYPYIQKHLGIPGDRLYVRYVDVNKAEMGYNGTTFDDLL